MRARKFVPPSGGRVMPLTALCFLVLAVSGILAFARPFSIQVVGLHALMGFVFVGLVALHVINNADHLKRYLRSKSIWITLGVTLILSGLFLWQPGPVRRVLALSQNLGPALDQFDVTNEGLIYHYHPAPQNLACPPLPLLPCNR